MKKILLLCSAIALTGCSSAPGDSDIENFLEPHFAPCKNINIVDIKKTNGYEEDGHYRVKYTYGIELKNSSDLKKAKKLWEKETESSIEYKNKSNEYHDNKKRIEMEIFHLTSSFNRSVPYVDIYKFSEKGDSSHLTWEQRSAYNVAVKERENTRPEPLIQKEKELETITADFKKYNESYKRPIFGSEVGLVMSRFYTEGCKPFVHKLTYNLLQEQGRAVNKFNDQSHWFDEYDINIQGSMTMRKTENGWQALSDG